MNFDYSEEQQQLADSVRKFLAAQYDFEKRKAIINSPSGFGEAVWNTFAEMGLTAIALPEADGGFVGGAQDLLSSLEAFGGALGCGAWDRGACDLCANTYAVARGRADEARARAALTEPVEVCTDRDHSCPMATAGCVDGACALQVPADPPRAARRWFNPLPAR